MSDMRETETSAARVPEQPRRQEAMGASTTAPAATPHRAAAPPEPTGWVGWIVFASMMMIMVGAFQVVVGLTALFDRGFYVVTENDLLVNVDYTAWGWAHLVLGALALAAAFGLLAAKMWARVVGIGMALVSAIVSMAFIAAYPVWSIIVTALDVLVIYAIAMHGQEIKGTDL